MDGHVIEHHLEPVPEGAGHDLVPPPIPGGRRQAIEMTSAVEPGSGHHESTLLRCRAQQAVVVVEGLLFRAQPEVVDADLADYFGSIPHADLLKWWRAGSWIARAASDQDVVGSVLWKKPTIEEARNA